MVPAPNQPIEPERREPESHGRQTTIDRISSAFIKVFLGLFALGAIATLFAPGIRSHSSPNRDNCTDHIRQLQIALKIYHDATGRFPPAYIPDSDGRPMHSWRAVILQYLDKDLYKQYRFDEPWNGPNNRKLADKMPAEFRCPSAPKSKTDTNYVAIVGLHTAWPGSVGIQMADITDQPTQTIMLVEIAESGINWLEPRDLPFEQIAQGINPPLSKLSVSSKHPGGVNVTFADGHLRYIGEDTSAKVFRALLTIDGGETIHENSY